MQRPNEQSIMLARMRGKLAGGSADQAKAEDNFRNGKHKLELGWGWIFVMLALFITANILGFSYDPVETKINKVNASWRLAPPAPTLTENDQALYWTYALYDFDKLMESFKTPKNAIIDARAAKVKLAALLPKVDRKTRFIIDGYGPRTK